MIICTKMPSLIAELKARVAAGLLLAIPSVRKNMRRGIGAWRPLLENSRVTISTARCILVFPAEMGERPLSILASRSLMLSISGAIRRASVLNSTTPRRIDCGAIGRDLTRSLINFLKIIQSFTSMLPDESSTIITSACTTLQRLIIGAVVIGGVVM